MKFHLVADALFEAGDIDHAFMRLSSYFRQLSERGTDAERLFKSGNCEITSDKTVTENGPALQ